MIEDKDGRPLVVQTARGLGVRAVVDIPVDEFGEVEPGEGMSVTVGSFRNLPEHRLPPSLGGTGKDPVWELDTDELPDGLAYRDDDELPNHGFIEPGWTMSLDDYEIVIAETRDLWRKCA